MQAQLGKRFYTTVFGEKTKVGRLKELSALLIE